MSWHFWLETERPCQETYARRGISISVNYHASLSLHASRPHLCKPQCAGATPLPGKTPEFWTICPLFWQKALVWLPKGFSVYLHIWQPVLYLFPLHVLVFSACLPCNHVSECIFFFFFFSFLFLSVLCLSAYIFTSAPAFLLGSLSSHPPRLTPGNATRASNRGIQQSSVKVIETWLTGQPAHSAGEINAAEPQWQLLPTHTRHRQKGGRGHAGLHPYVSLQANLWKRPKINPGEGHEIARVYKNIASDSITNLGLL